jgi:hypothetical protein
MGKYEKYLHSLQFVMDNVADCSCLKLTNCQYFQGCRNDVKARGADFRERALLN